MRLSPLMRRMQAGKIEKCTPGRLLPNKMEYTLLSKEYHVRPYPIVCEEHKFAASRYTKENEEVVNDRRAMVSLHIAAKLRFNIFYGNCWETRGPLR